MAKQKPQAIAPAAFLSAAEEYDVIKKVKFELAYFQHKVVNIGGILNPIAGLLIILTLWHKSSATILVSWYAALASVNFINVFIAYRNRNITLDQPTQWRNAQKAYHIMITILSFIYGCTGILYTSNEMHYQLFVITFLEFLIVGFNLGTITDIVACSLSNIGLLVPYLSWSILSFYNHYSTPSYSVIDFSYAITFIIIALFFYMSAYVGNILIRKFFHVSFEKTILSEKLESANKLLEQRVKERTIELEKSLNLVTYQATHDLLTDLPNQRLLIEYINAAIANSNENKTVFALVCLSLNEVDRINESLGHHMGDLVIRTIAERLNETFGAKKENYKITLSRKDVFVILIASVTLSDLEKQVSELFLVIEEPVHVDSNIVKLTASLGVSTYPQDGHSHKELVMNADAAMLRAKHQGGNALHVYETKLNADVYKKLQLESNLHDAVKNSEFVLQYQPIVNLQTGKVCELEALVRWQHPLHGFVPPIDFIPLAEADGLILPLGEWVLRTACRQLVEWQAQGFHDLRVAVNLSAKQLNQKNITHMIKEILQETGLNPHSLELELTETEAFKDNTVPILQEFKAMGLYLAVDDFGTGYSGLSNIKQVTIDKLKIDKSFVQDITTSSGSKAIVENIIALAKSIHARVLAEGVETKIQLEILKEKGCDMIQGYYFSPPLNAEAVTDLLNGKRPFEYLKNRS